VRGFTGAGLALVRYLIHLPLISFSSPWIGCNEFLDKFDPVNETVTHFLFLATFIGASRTEGYFPQSLFAVSCRRNRRTSGEKSIATHFRQGHLKALSLGKTIWPQSSQIKRPLERAFMSRNFSLETQYGQRVSGGRVLVGKRIIRVLFARHGPGDSNYTCLTHSRLFDVEPRARAGVF
jgi:hypothetical protein